MQSARVLASRTQQADTLREPGPKQLQRNPTASLIPTRLPYNRVRYDSAKITGACIYIYLELVMNFVCSHNFGTKFDITKLNGKITRECNRVES